MYMCVCVCMPAHPPPSYPPYLQQPLLGSKSSLLSSSCRRPPTRSHRGHTSIPDPSTSAHPAVPVYIYIHVQCWSGGREGGRERKEGMEGVREGGGREIMLKVRQVIFSNLYSINK